MSDEYDNDQESFEQGTTDSQAAPDTPDWAKKQVQQANREAEGLRKRLRERESEILSSKYEGVIDLLPDEVTSYDAKVAFLEKAQTKFGSTNAPAEPTEQSETPPAPVEEPTEQQAQNLAAVGKGPSATGVPSSGLTMDELMNVAMTDPERYESLKKQGVELPKLSWGPDR